MIKNVFVVFFSFFLIISCKKDDLIVDNLDDSSNQDYVSSEIAFPNQKGNIISFEREDGSVFSYEEINGVNVFEGDIILSDSQVEFMKKINSSRVNTKSAPSTVVRRWNNSRVNFVIEIPGRRADIEWAINQIQNATNIVFNERREGNYIAFVLGEGCSSKLGMQGGRQNIILENGCSRGNIIHEILHALGIFHEQSRPDRDNSVRINYGNIQNGRASQFDIKLALNYGDFDFNSIMLYGPCFFANACFPNGDCNCNPNEATITRRDGTLYNINRNNLSLTDIDVLRDMYPVEIRSVGNFGAYDVGANDRGDVCYARRNGRFLEVYRNGVLHSRSRNTLRPLVDITGNGEVLTTLESFRYGNGKFSRYTKIDIAEGGGNVYCIATNTRNTSVFRRIGSNTWVKEPVSGSRISVDSQGIPWVIQSNKLITMVGGEYTTVATINTSNFKKLVDIGCSGNNVFVSTIARNNTFNHTFRYSRTANLLIKQPGTGGNIDTNQNGVILKP